MITSFFSPKNKQKSKAPTEPAAPQSIENSLQTQQNKRIKTNHSSPSPSPLGLGKSNSNFNIPEVQELLSYLDQGEDNDSSKSSNQSSNNIPKTWHHVLLPRLQHNGSWFINLAKFVSKERQTQTIYPPPHETFACLNLTPLSELKVVIVGQDPYHGPNQGHGLCFSVRKGVAIPPSLLNVYKELRNDERVSFGPSSQPPFSSSTSTTTTTESKTSTIQNPYKKKNDTKASLPKHGNLEQWAKQGVLLLNAVLTVRKGNANSHAKKGWEQFTDHVIEVLNKEYSERGLVFLLWGKPASKKAEKILASPSGKRHTIICTSHPSPLGATKTSSPFMGSKCFSRANDALIERGLDPIDWNVDGDL